MRCETASQASHRLAGKSDTQRNNLNANVVVETMQPWREMRSPLGERRGLQRDDLSLSSEGPAGAHRWRGGLAFEAEEGRMQKPGSKNIYNLFWEQQEVGNYC